ncbi:MAG: response regulator [Acidobacteriota bacterium]
MKILVADDDTISRFMLETVLNDWGYDVVTARDGREAWEILQSKDAPLLAILDWIMPELDGLEVCRKTRLLGSRHAYLILLTARDEKEDIVRGLEAGANDYLTKPFDEDELRARVGVGAQMVALQEELVRRVEELEEALTHVKTLQGMLPICSYCKNIRDDKNYWHGVESYITEHSEAVFSHSICPSCFANVLGHQLERFEEQIDLRDQETEMKE